MMLLNCGVGEDSWESFYCKEIKPVNPKGDQPWVFIGRTDSEAETPILWSSDGKSWLIRKDSDAGKDWRQEKRMTEVEILGWHHQLITNSPEQAPEDGEEQGTLTCCSPWGCKESDMPERLNCLTFYNYVQNMFIICNIWVVLLHLLRCRTPWVIRWLLTRGKRLIWKLGRQQSPL